LIVAGYILVQGKGLWPTPSNKDYQRQLNAHEFNTKPASRFAYNCQVFKNDPALWLDPRCIIGDTSKPAEVLLWGDSNAAHYVGYFKTVAEHEHFAIRNMSHSSCPPIRGDLNGMVSPAAQNSCNDFNIRAFAESKKVKTVIVGAAWESYIKAKSKPQFEKTIAELSSNGNQVVIALNVPVFNNLDRMCGAKALRIPGMDCKSRSLYQSTSDSDVNNYLINLASKYPNVSTFSVRDYICKSGTCSAYQGDNLLYYDRGHLSMVGSEIIGKEAIKAGTVPKEILALTTDD